MACHVFTHEFQSGIKIRNITFLECVRINPHSSSFTNVGNSTSNFLPSVQISCGEKEREENNGNCKAFALHENAKNPPTITSTRR